MLLIRLHDGFSPIDEARFRSPGAHGDLQHLVLILLRWIVVADEAAVDLHLTRVIFRSHVAAAVPTFVSNPKGSDLVRSSVTIGSALFADRRSGRSSHILQPVGGFVRSP